MPFVVVGLIILFIFWDELFYAIGGILGLGVLFCLLAAYGSHSESKLSDEEWNDKHPDQERRPDTSKHYIIAALIFGTLSYFAIDYQTSTWHNPELIAQEEAAKKAEQERLKAESLEKYRIERNEKNLQRISEFDDEEKNLFDTKFQEYLNAEINEIDARTKAVDDVNRFASDKAKEKLRAELAERKSREEAEKAKQERIAAEEKARAEAERLAAEQKAIEDEKNKPRTRSAKKLDYNNQKKANPNFRYNEDIEDENRAVKIIDYLGVEGEIALQYWIAKRPEFIAMTAKQENATLSAAKTAAELKEIENRRDKLYSELENSYSKTATTDEEFKNQMQESFKVLDDFYAQISDKIENDKQSLLNKWRSEILSK